MRAGPIRCRCERIFDAIFAFFFLNPYLCFIKDHIIVNTYSVTEDLYFSLCQPATSNCCQLFCTSHTHTHARTHTRLTALFPGLPGWAGTRQVKPIWVLLKQETVSGSGISWTICKSAPRSRQTTMPAPHHSVFSRADALPAAQPTASKHWRHIRCCHLVVSSAYRSLEVQERCLPIVGGAWTPFPCIPSHPLYVICNPTLIPNANSYS